MTQASTQIAKQYMEGALNKKNWGTAMYNVLVEGLVGGGVIDDTVALQTLINTAIAAGRKVIFFPHGQYYVTALTNANQVVLIGDNASFVGGYTGEINQLGEGGVTQAELDALKAESVTNIANLVTGFGADPTGATDSSTAVQAAIDSLPNGGLIYCPGRFLIGGIIVNAENITFVGRSTDDELIIKNGTTGITVRQNFVSFENITVISQGTKGDGLGTNGIYYEKTPVNSIGFAKFANVNIKNFSGYGLKMINPIHFTYDFGYILSCTSGIVFDRDSGGVLFGTTVTIKRVYISSCGRGIDSKRLWRSSFEEVIAEFCTYGMYMQFGAFTLYRCYFENNTTKGCYVEDAEVQDLYTYSNNTVTDGVQIANTGAVANVDRGYAQSNKFDVLAKRLGLLSNFGVDPKYFSAYGGSNNVGLQYGDAIVPIIRGDNIADPAAWVSNRSAEFLGWDFTNQGYKVQGTSAGDTTYGIKQDITLDNTKQYVIDVASTTVLGAGITLIKCGATTVINGVPFTPPANGANTIKAYGTDTVGTPFECYIHAFVISEVLVKTKYTAIAEDKLTRKQLGRGVIQASAAPTTGYFAVGERIENSAPTLIKNISHWICITSPTTFAAYGCGQGTTAQRPTLAANDRGYSYFDTTLAKMIAWSGTAWLV